MEQKMIDLQIKLDSDGTFSYSATKFEIWGATTDLGNGKGFASVYSLRVAAQRRFEKAGY